MPKNALIYYDRFGSSIEEHDKVTVPLGIDYEYPVSCRVIKVFDQLYLDFGMFQVPLDKFINGIELLEHHSAHLLDG